MTTLKDMLERMIQKPDEDMKVTQEAIIELLKDPVRRKVCNDLARDICIIHDRLVTDHKKKDPMTNIEVLLVGMFVNTHMNLYVAASMTECGHKECIKNEGHLLFEAGRNINHAMIDAAEAMETPDSSH